MVFFELSDFLFFTDEILQKLKKMINFLFFMVEPGVRMIKVLVRMVLLEYT